MPRLLLAAAILALSAFPAQADVFRRSPDGFVLSFDAPAQMDPADFLASLERMPDWWDSAHTYSGAASNLSLSVTPGGCWCEALADGSTFTHATVRSVSADKVVFDAPLGPLNGKATSAELTIQWIATERGLTPMWTFEVEGPGVGAMADGVNAVMDAGFRRWVDYLEAAA